MTNTTPPDMRAQLIAAGVRNLKEFGYPEVNAENILTDQVFATFFKNMLVENKGRGADDVIDQLIDEVTANEERTK
jgi:hypothetical protein